MVMGRGSRIKALGPYPTLVKTLLLQPAWYHMLWCGYIREGVQLLLTFVVHQSQVLSGVICTAKSL